MSYGACARPLPPYDHGESAPLVQARSSKERRGWASTVAFLLGMLSVIVFETVTFMHPRIQSLARQGWALEIQQHDAFIKQWDREILRYRDEKKQWAEEEAELAQVRREERIQWDVEKSKNEEERKHERAEWEREKFEREKLTVWFTTPSPSNHCRSWGTREYSAVLLNAPDTVDKLRLCAETKADIHGRMLFPQSCTVHVDEGVVGHWIVDFEEAACSPSFTNVQDKGCLNIGSWKRTFHAHLDGIQPGDDWRMMCSTAPADLAGHHFNAPSRCDDWGQHGIWGIFDIYDASWAQSERSLWRGSSPKVRLLPLPPASSLENERSPNGPLAVTSPLSHFLTSPRLPNHTLGAVHQRRASSSYHHHHLLLLPSLLLLLHQHHPRSIAESNPNAFQTTPKSFITPHSLSLNPSWRHWVLLWVLHCYEDFSIIYTTVQTTMRRTRSDSAASTIFRALPPGWVARNMGMDIYLFHRCDETTRLVAAAQALCPVLSVPSPSTPVSKKIHYLDGLHGRSKTIGSTAFVRARRSIFFATYPRMGHKNKAKHISVAEHRLVRWQRNQEFRSSEPGLWKKRAFWNVENVGEGSVKMGEPGWEKCRNALDPWVTRAVHILFSNQFKSTEGLETIKGPPLPNPTYPINSFHHHHQHQHNHPHFHPFLIVPHIMTRTERSVNPRAVIRDRSESKSGLDKSMPKNGAGTHNWGSFADERELEDAALADEQQDLGNARSKSHDKSPVRSPSGMTPEDVQKAKEFRKNALKADGIDLAAIARTSAAVSTSPPRSPAV
ncbi:hypothetical protein ONZ45_g1777 [Pleurotus djamor]|nr:hypothetical protein ONZ45_g1777 [Pleurotus djamor]